jgi:hypothetical protein
MMEHEDSALPRTPHHEAHRLNVRALLWFAIAFVIAGLLMHVALWGIMGIWARETNSHHPVQAAAQFQGANRAPPLQPSPEHGNLPFQDLANMRADQQSQLNANRPAESGFGTISIDRAMTLALEKQALATRPGASTHPFVQTEVGQ